MPPSTELMAVSSAVPAARSWLERLWSTIADRGQSFAGVSEVSAPPLDRAKGLAEALLSERGEASGAAIARELHTVLRGLGLADRTAFYGFLAAAFAPDADALRAAAEAYFAVATPERAERLAAAAEPPRQELLRRMNMAPGGTAALVAARRELLGPPPGMAGRGANQAAPVCAARRADPVIVPRSRPRPVAGALEESYQEWRRLSIWMVGPHRSMARIAHNRAQALRGGTFSPSSSAGCNLSSRSRVTPADIGSACTSAPRAEWNGRSTAEDGTARPCLPAAFGCPLRER